MNILGYEYEILHGGSRDEIGAMGKVDIKGQRIFIAADMCDETKVSTLIHEIIEAINSHLELNVPHQVISALEVGIFQAFINNGVDLSPLLSHITPMGVKEKSHGRKEKGSRKGKASRS